MQNRLAIDRDEQSPLWNGTKAVEEVEVSLVQLQLAELKLFLIFSASRSTSTTIVVASTVERVSRKPYSHRPQYQFDE